MFSITKSFQIKHQFKVCLCKLGIFMPLDWNSGHLVLVNQFGILSVCAKTFNLAIAEFNKRTCDLVVIRTGTV